MALWDSPWWYRSSGITVGRASSELILGRGQWWCKKSLFDKDIKGKVTSAMILCISRYAIFLQGILESVYLIDTRCWGAPTFQGTEMFLLQRMCRISPRLEPVSHPQASVRAGTDQHPRHIYPCYDLRPTKTCLDLGSVKWRDIMFKFPHLFLFLLEERSRILSCFRDGLLGIMGYQQQDN